MRIASCISERQEHCVWILVAGFWALGGAVAWLSAFALPQAWEVSSSLITVLAVGVALISAAIRLPVLTDPPRTALTSDHLVWLLGSIASSYWLAVFFLRSPTLIEALPAAMVLVATEVWLFRLAWRGDKLPWLHTAIAQFCYGLIPGYGSTPENYPASRRLDYEPARVDQPVGPARPLTPSAGTTAVVSKGELPIRELSDCGVTETVSLIGIVEETGEPNFVRRMVEGLDENNCRYMSGEVEVTMRAQQQNESLVIGFCPAFIGEPSVDFECEEEDISIRLVNCTPTGMRLGVRRKQMDSKVKFQVGWYAAELKSVGQPTETSRLLP